MPLPQLYCSERLIEGVNGRLSALHAKCVVKDQRQVFVSSANFTEAGQNRNIEVGVLIDSRPIAERLCRFFQALVDNQFFLRVL